MNATEKQEAAVPDLSKREIVSGLWMLSRLADALEAIYLRDKAELERANRNSGRW